MEETLLGKINEADTTNLLTFSQRLALAIDDRGFTKAWIARQLGISPQAFNYLLKPDARPRYLDQLSRLLSVSPEWLATGNGPVTFEAFQREKHNLPLLDRRSVQHWLNGQRLPNPNHAELVPINDDPRNYLAYRLSNDALFPPFLEGSALIFKLGETPQHGDHVLVVTLRDEIMVRKWLQDGNTICLWANNSDYRTIEGSEIKRVIGVLHEARYQVSR